MKDNKRYIYQVNDYQKQKPFSSFLSGIAGKLGIPLWAFYVNRGQLIASFGIRDKNGAMMEFYPANQAYHFVSRIGFRTFIKINGKVHEFFKEKNENQSLIVKQDQVQIFEENKDLKIKVIVTYFTLPNENLAGLVRKVEVINMSDEVKDILIIDGLAQMIPSGIDFGSYKAVSNLLQSWMQNIHENDYVFYKLRASTDDSAEVNLVQDGNFYLSKSSKNAFYISDYKLVFDEDTSLETPYGLINHSYQELTKTNQTHVNQVPCAMSLYEFSDIKSETIVSVIGYSKDKEFIDQFINKVSTKYFYHKEVENKQIHDDLMSSIETKTSKPILDLYFKQCYLDNVLRGGTPEIFKTLDGQIGYHLFSRKHGDLERDYNFFSLEPAFYSQGNGNFRDVLQNRRNDIFFNPDIQDFNIYQFASLIQADGYNPLSIEGVKFKFDGDITLFPISIQKLLKDEFTPGMIATKLYNDNLEIHETLRKVLLSSHVLIKASFGEGYWEDHFTYLYDLIESYLSIYPDHLEELVFVKKFPFFNSPVKVLPRHLKYVKTKEGKIRQYGAINHSHDKNHKSWLENKSGLLKINLFGKLLTLILNKFGHLDPYGIGLSYEGNKPGWNDAMNGVPGLFGSGVSETIELKKLVKLLKSFANQHQDYKVLLLNHTDQLATNYMHLKEKDSVLAWNERMTYLEKYRDQLGSNLEIVSQQVSHYNQLLELIDKELEKALVKAKEINPIYPTYLTYEAKEYVELLDENQKPIIGEYGLPTVKILSFEMKPLPVFLESPARYLKALSNKDEAKNIYESIKKTGLYDQKLKFYQTSVSLDDYDHEIGRIRAFTPGWLERESNFLHMTYKYLLGILKSGLYDEFYDEIKTNFTCFMNPKIYGRAPFENSSFLATSSNPDPKKHGQGFVSRLSGSTAEVLSMFRYMFFGEKLFGFEDGQLYFELSPKLSYELFENNQVSAKLFGKTMVTYHLDSKMNTYDQNAYIEKIILAKDQETTEVIGSKIFGKWTRDIREGHVLNINVYIRGGK